MSSMELGILLSSAAIAVASGTAGVILGATGGPARVRDVTFPASAVL